MNGNVDGNKDKLPMHRVDQHWLVNVCRVPSPNCDARPEGEGIDLIVIHGISLPPGEFGLGYVDQLFTNQLCADAHGYFRQIADLRVSSHVLIDRLGQVTQYVGFDQRAWHAGCSAFRGRSACNDFSIGIELEGTDDLPYTAAQYDQLLSVIQALYVAYPSCRHHPVVGHSDIAPGRKTDPGPCFDWGLLAKQAIPVL